MRVRCSPGVNVQVQVLLKGGDYSSKAFEALQVSNSFEFKPNREVFHKSSDGLVTFIALLGLI